MLLLGDRSIARARWVALLGSLATLALCVPLWRGFDTTPPRFQFVESAAVDPALQRRTTRSASTASRCR